MLLDNEEKRIGKDRLLRVFQYLKALNEHRNPVKRQIREQPWVLWLGELPVHNSISYVGYIETNDNETEDKTEDDFIIRVRRPKITAVPKPPEQIVEWLEKGWDDPEQEIKIAQTREEVDENGEAHLIRFDEDPKRMRAFENWQRKRKEWANNEIPARQATKIFERFYDLYGWLQKESERYELVIGDGILNWRCPNISIHHPVLLQRVQLEFDPDIPEFSVIETDHGAELYTAILQSITDVDGREIANSRMELLENNYHPLGGEATAGFFKRLVNRLSSKGEFVGENVPSKDSDEPKIGRSPVLFLRSRTFGFATAIESILEDLPKRENINGSLYSVVGVERGFAGEREGGTADKLITEEDILLSKIANQEQIEIAKRLEKYNAVLVQGPPGTGKTHTIANLLGHLLAQGKSVLVTSHTTKALRVLRRQVVKKLRPLCVSVLDNDSVSRKQLEDSVETIVEWLSSFNAQQLERKAQELTEQRKRILAELNKKRQELLNACYDEYRDVVVNGVGYSPSDAARIVSEGYGKHNWIPSPVTLGAPLPISQNEAVELYRTNISVKPEDEIELGGILPKPQDLVVPEEFKQLVIEFEALSKLNLPYREDLWEGESTSKTPDEVNSLGKRMLKAVDSLNDEEWKLAVIAAGYKGGAHRISWESLLKKINEVVEAAAQIQETIFKYQPKVSDHYSLDEQAIIAEEIVSHLNNGGKFGFWTFLKHSKWKGFIENSSVFNKTPSSIEQFKALRDYIRLQQLRGELTGRWDLQVSVLGAPVLKELMQPPEEVAAQFSPFIKSCLDWHDKIWDPLVKELKSYGFRWDKFIDEQPPNLNPNGELVRLKEAVLGPLKKVLEYRAKYIRYKQIKTVLDRVRGVLEVAGGNGECAQLTSRILDAVIKRDTELYKQAFQRLVDLYGRRSDLQLRRELLGRIDKVAPAWSAAIRERQAPHDAGALPGDIEAAWLWRQLHDELEKRAQTSLTDLQQRIERLSTELRRLTKELIMNKAWAAQLRRITLPEKQALEGYLSIMKRIGAGTGKRVPRLRAEARRKTSECRKAVPVWIMPLARVAENFDPRFARFDVVIIDEASQCDLMGLIAIYMAQQVVIVGDHEQVSPAAVGQKLDVVEHLIDVHLQGIPNNILYDGQRSVYDLAKESFGGTICLLEHFRCVPEIIQFSNKLSYNWRIKPLRETSQVSLKPHVIAYRVKDAITENKVNREEALTVASLLVAAIEQPEYKDKTFGVISLVGDEQAMEIEKQLRLHLPENEFERRRIICGNAAHFQGDERDVMFLSIVDSCDNPPLKMRGPGYLDMYKKRYNVAASRACDQMWVVHSLDPRTDLQAGDLRRQLIEHAENPQAIMEELESAEKDTESVFEKEVMLRLISAGFRVTPQWKAGYLRIDLVVEGNGRRLAVECDGDRYHTIEKLEEDMARQAILERLGWTFVRIRGSVFYRDPDKAMQPVFDRLDELRITPQGADSNLEQTKDAVEQELKDRVCRRAAELRREWMESENKREVIEFEDVDDIYEEVNQSYSVKQQVESSVMLSPPNMIINTTEQYAYENNTGNAIGGELYFHSVKPFSGVFEALDDYIMSLGNDVEKRKTKKYYAYKRGKNFACVLPSNGKILVYLKVDPNNVKLEKGFTRDVTKINHPGTGDLELTIKNFKDLEKAKSLIYMSYSGYKGFLLQ
jgi:predicted transport protein/very-short-patch-repair endonuclease/DNA polymerase III delta prime subunit